MIVSPFLPYISMHILPTVLYTFPKLLTRRICLTTKENAKKIACQNYPCSAGYFKVRVSKISEVSKMLWNDFFHFSHLDTGEFNKTCRQQFRKTEKRIGKTRRVDTDALLHVALDNDNNSLCCLYVDDNVYKTFSKEILMRIVIEL